MVSRNPQPRKESSPNAPSRSRVVITTKSEEQPRSVAEKVLTFLGPFSLSLVIHACLLMILSLLTWAVGTAGADGPGEFTARLVDSATHAGRGSFEFLGDENMQREDAAASADRIKNLAELLEQDESLKMEAAASGSSGIQDVTSDTLRRGDVTGTQMFAGGGGGAASGGVGSGSLSGGGPVGGMWGVGADQHAESIVYVMDRSGSMSEAIANLKYELKKAIGELSEEQRFNVFWFNDEKRPQRWARTLMPATIENKRAAFKAIDEVVPEGKTDPIPAVTGALRYRGLDVMFLLSDGDFGEQNLDVLESIREANRGKGTIINTILFLGQGYYMGTGENVLQRIARENGGTYKHVTADDFRR